MYSTAVAAVRNDAVSFSFQRPRRPLSSHLRGYALIETVAQADVEIAAGARITPIHFVRAIKHVVDFRAQGQSAATITEPRQFSFGAQVDDRSSRPFYPSQACIIVARLEVKRFDGKT